MRLLIQPAAASQITLPIPEVAQHGFAVRWSIHRSGKNDIRSDTRVFVLDSYCADQ